MALELKSRPKPITYGGIPRVNLLPPAERSRRKLVKLQRRMVLGVIAALVLTVVAFMAAYGMRVQAERSRDAEADRKSELQSQLAEYSDVSARVAERDNLLTKRSEALYDDMAWSEPFQLLAPALPTGAKLTGFEASTGGPVTGKEGEIGLKSVATVTSPKPIDQATVLDRFARVEHVTDVDMLGLQKGEGFYTYRIYVAFDQGIYGKRFQLKKGATK